MSACCFVRGLLNHRSARGDILYPRQSLAYHDDGEVMVPPDYDKTLEFLQVRGAEALLCNLRGAPHLLLHVVHDTSDELDDDIIPSCVPRWTTSLDAITRPMPLSLTYEHRRSEYRASYGSAPFDPSPPQDNILTVMGSRFDTVAWNSPSLRSGHLGRDVSKCDPGYRGNKISAVKSIWQQLLARSSKPLEQMISSFSLTLARGRPRLARLSQ